AERIRHPRFEDVEERALEEEEHEDGPGKCGDRERRQANQRHGDQRPDHARSRTTSPSSPLGRKIRIKISIEKARMSLYSAPNAPPVSSERYAAAKASRSPRTSPPSIAPGMFPIPPSTAAVNAFRPGMKPLQGLMSPYWTPKSTAAAPPIAPPLRNVREMLRL